MKEDLKTTIAQFGVCGETEPYGNGHINDTYLVTAKCQRYILQKINKQIFRNPMQLMENIAMVTEHLKKTNTDKNLSIVKTINDNWVYVNKYGEYFRMYNYIENSHTYEIVPNSEIFYSAAKAFGRFQKGLLDFNSQKINEIIPDFHNTEKRIENLILSIKGCNSDRFNQTSEEIEFVLERRSQAGIISDALKSGGIPWRVTHNDTKLNNVLFDNDTNEAVCVIDLDTIMQGSLLYDFGDAIRFGANCANEDEQDLSKVKFDINLFEAYVKGFLEEMGDYLNPKEIELLAFSAKLMAYECGIRFLTDFLDNDKYFKISRPNHNLDRCRVQFELVRQMELQTKQMERIIINYLGKKEK